MVSPSGGYFPERYNVSVCVLNVVLLWVVVYFYVILHFSGSLMNLDLLPRRVLHGLC